MQNVIIYVGTVTAPRRNSPERGRDTIRTFLEKSGKPPDLEPPPVGLLPSHCGGVSADCKRGRRKGATSKNVKNRQKVSKSFSTIFAQGKKRQKSSKSVKKFFDTFRQFSRRAKKRQKSSKSVKKFFNTFRQFSRGPFFPAPFAIR